MVVAYLAKSGIDVESFRIMRPEFDSLPAAAPEPLFPIPRPEGEQ